MDLVETIEGHPPAHRFLDVSQGMAAILFLKSLCHDTSLSSLVQSSYDLTPFTLDSVCNQIMLEDSRRESHDSGTSYLLHPVSTNPRTRSKSHRHSDRGKAPLPRQSSTLPRSAVPTKKLPHTKDSEIQAKVNQLAKELK